MSLKNCWDEVGLECLQQPPRAPQHPGLRPVARTANAVRAQAQHGVRLHVEPNYISCISARHRYEKAKTVQNLQKKEDEKQKKLNKLTSIGGQRVMLSLPRS